MKLNRSAVYNPHKADMLSSELGEASAPAARIVISEDVIVADHFFDTPERGRCKPVQTSKLLPYRE